MLLYVDRNSWIHIHVRRKYTQRLFGEIQLIVHIRLQAINDKKNYRPTTKKSIAVKYLKMFLAMVLSIVVPKSNTHVEADARWSGNQNIKHGTIFNSGHTHICQTGKRRVNSQTCDNFCKGSHTIFCQRLLRLVFI